MAFAFKLIKKDGAAPIIDHGDILGLFCKAVLQYGHEDKDRPPMSIHQSPVDDKVCFDKLRQCHKIHGVYLNSIEVCCTLWRLVIFFGGEIL